MVQFAIDCLAQVFEVALPVAIVFEIGNLLASTLLRVGFGGRLWFGK